MRMGKNRKGDSRGADGRWLPGHACGPGRPSVQRAIELRQLAQGCVSDERLKAIMDKLILMALAGDVQAAVAVLDRVMGKPIDMSVIEGDTHNHYPILVTTTAETIKQLEATRGLDEDPMRGIKRLPKGNGK